jgi:hypothetical protein
MRSKKQLSTLPAYLSNRIVNSRPRGFTDLWTNGEHPHNMVWLHFKLSERERILLEGVDYLCPHGQVNIPGYELLLEAVERDGLS